MNRFRTRRRAKDQQQGDSHTELHPSHALPFASRGFGKSKKSLPEYKPAIDLSTALPSSNEFRTSLIMPNLSARFSMLREQDDPSTKIGKANDDSVLFPKRVSRLNLFSHNPLTDIAEVDSIRDSISPPFAGRERGLSLDEVGYDSDAGSMMGRSRPGEGNNLFGGRQKLYKIPFESSTKSPLNTDISPPDSGSMPGRVMYESDVSRSLFQKHREKEREERRAQTSRNSLDEADDYSPPSPATSFSKDRGTNSSTMSAPRPSSTAATSVTSQSPSSNPNNGSASSLSSTNTNAAARPAADRSGTAYRKLYGQGLHQSNNMHRIAHDNTDHTGHPRAPTVDKRLEPVLSLHGKSNLTEGSAGAGLSFPFNFRSVSPPPPLPASPSGFSTIDRNLRDERPLEIGQGNTYGFARPLSPPASDGEDVTPLASSVQPGDRGKATALGLFNKPARSYDEHQFSQRQLQMHQGRESPSSQWASTTPASTPAASEETAGDLKLEEDAEELRIANDARAKVASLIRRQNEELSTLEAQRTAGGGRTEPQRPSSPPTSNQDTFLEDDEDEEPPSESTKNIPGTNAGLSPEQTHPAFRPVVEGFTFPPFDSEPRSQGSSVGHRPLPSRTSDYHPSDRDDGDFEVPTEGLGLSGLIRTHLRHDSDRSSIYPPASPRFPSHAAEDSPNLKNSPSAAYGFGAPSPAQPIEAQSTMAQNAKHFLNMATVLKNQSENQSQSLRSARNEQAFPPSTQKTWQDELGPKHHRDASTATQQEREAFNHELAERRRKVQEKLKKVADGNSRSVSPAPFPDVTPVKPGMGLSAMLRAKSSRTKLNNNEAGPPPLPTSINVPEHSGKAMKLLGLTPGSTSTTESPQRSPAERWKEEEQRMLDDFARRPKPGPKFGPSPRKAFPHSPDPASSKSSQYDDNDRYPQRSATPASTPSSDRDRSASDVSGRSQGRNGPYRDDLEKAMVEGAGSQARFHGFSNTLNTSMAGRAPIEVGEQQEGSVPATLGRYRSDSRSNTPSYFESLSVDPLQSGLVTSASVSGKSSPTTPFSAHSTPPIIDSAPAPSNASTATLTQVADGRVTPSFRSRKRSVTKNMISDPTFISTTYTVTTVDLPPGASLRNGSPVNHPKDSSPTLPFLNPARRRGRIGAGPNTATTLFSNLAGRGNDSGVDLSGPRSARPLLPQERSKFSDEGNAQPAPLRPRQKLRKVSSEGGDLSAKARYQALMSEPSPALPTFPVKRGPSPTMQRGPSPAMRGDVSPAMRQGPSPTMWRGPSPTMRRGPSPTMRPDPLPGVQRMEGGMF